MLHLFPHWNWQDGDTVDVWAYYNNADSVELYLNGRSHGCGEVWPDTYNAKWSVPFEKGTLVAVSRNGGVEVCRDTVETAGDPFTVRLTPEPLLGSGDGYDLHYIKVEIVDARGVVCLLASNEVEFDVTGVIIEGTDNGNPLSHERFKGKTRKAFYGKALLIVRKSSQDERMGIKANSSVLLQTVILYDM